MKEFEYRSFPGLEEKNTPTAEDIFELTASEGLKDRQIFDFSFTNPSTQYDSVKNLSAYGYRSDGSGIFDRQGRPNPAALMVIENYADFENTPVVNDQTNSINYTILAPKLQENGMIYLGYEAAGDLPSNIDYFRSGYAEFTIKLEKENCTILYGSLLFSTPRGAAGAASIQIADQRPSLIDSSTAWLSEPMSNISESELSVKNGKLLYSFTDKYGPNNVSYELSGNKNIADGKWHHIVINFSKPGMIKTFGKKTNEKAIEFWVDGKLDARDSSLFRNKKVFFPIFEWFGGNPGQVFKTTVSTQNPLLTDLDGWKTYDSQADPSIGYRDETNPITLRAFKDRSSENLFLGAIHTYNSGINIPLSKDEIEFRYNLWFGKKLAKASCGSATATMLEPQIYSNKPKALKLFWNNLILQDSANGVELDENFNVETYSVTHKCLNSPSEIYNVDNANSKAINFLSDVRFVFTDNVIPFGPGKMIEANYPEMFNFVGVGGKGIQQDMSTYYSADNFWILEGGQNPSEPGTRYYGNKFISAIIKNYKFSGSEIQEGDRVLLVNQFNPKDNGIWVYNGPDSLITRPSDADSPSKLFNGVVRVTDGYYKDTSWAMTNNINSLDEKQEWQELEFHPESETINSQPVFLNRWQDENGNYRMIDLQKDVDLSKYDLICFMNYPESENDLKNHFVNYSNSEIRIAYDGFIKSLEDAIVSGSNVFVSSGKLALDLGIVSSVQEVGQEIQEYDLQSASLDPFKVNEEKERYFDTHRNNKYRVSRVIEGLTNKPGYVMTDFINYIPENSYDYEEWHIKYNEMQNGLALGTEFYIPGLSLRYTASRDDLPGYRQNSKSTKNLKAIPSSDILSGKDVTKFANTYYVDDTAVPNQYNDMVTTIVIEPGDQLKGRAVSGKVFVNLVEDSFVYSKKEYNKSVIQDFDSSNETLQSALWQYSTTRKLRQPKTTNVAGISKYGETSPTFNGGGPLLQGQTASSSGIIRSKTDQDNEQNKSSLYGELEEEQYPLIEINTYSMTWLGLQWLTGQ